MTTTITKFDKPTCGAIAEELEAALKAVATKYGLTAHYAGGTFSPTEFTARLKLTVTDAAAIEAKGRREIETYGAMYGLTPEDYGVEFQVKGLHYKLVGLAPSKAKYPIVATRLFDDVVMGFPATVVPLVIRKGA